MINFKQVLAHFSRMVGSIRETLKRRKYLWLLVLIVAFLYSSLSILRHRHFTSSAFDLGIFDQAIWQYSEFQAPYVSVRSNRLTENILGDHFHPILVLLAPLYWLTDSVEALLITQALLFAIAIVPIFLFTEKRLGQMAGYLFAISYAIFWGIQKAVEFDFHEIALAVPLTALAIYFIDEKRWRVYFVCLVLLLLTKENLSILVFFFGVYLLTQRQFKRALISMGAGMVWFVAVTKVFIPFFIDPETTRIDRANNYYRYWSYNHLGSGPLNVLLNSIKNPLLIIKTLFSPGTKLHTYWLLFHPFLFLAFFSPLFILAIPLLAERFLSENASLWTADFHYTNVLVPVIVMASVDGLSRITQRIKKVRPRYLVIIAASCLVLLLNLRLLPEFPLWNLTTPAHWRLTSNELTGRKALSLIPPTASVTTQGPITPHLTHRRVVYVLHPALLIPDSDYIVASERINPYPFLGKEDIKAFLDYQEARGYRKIFEEDGWVVFKAEPMLSAVNRQNNDAAFVEQSVPDSMTAGQSYDVFVTLKNTGIKSWKSSEAYRLAYLSGNLDWILERVELPATIEPGSIVKFEFKVKAPQNPGTYSFHWGMVQDGVAAFGERAPQVWVKVTAAEASPK